MSNDIIVSPFNRIPPLYHSVNMTHDNLSFQIDNKIETICCMQISGLIYKRYMLVVSEQLTISSYPSQVLTFQ